MFDKHQVIEFGLYDDVLPLPKPAKTFVPEWYKKSPRHTDNSDQLTIQSAYTKSNKGIKYCVPFLDGLTHGYIAELWCDVQVIRHPDGPQLGWSVDLDVAQVRDPKGFEKLPIPAGHLKNHFVWKNPYMIKTPKGYSCLITHPLNRFDLPFTTLSAVIDADSVMPPGNMPFYLREDFEGIIPAGTPIYQIIPFKRDNWKSEQSEQIYKEGKRRMFQALGSVGKYKRDYWAKKEFE